MRKFSSYRILTKPKFFQHLGVLYHSAQAIYPFIILPGYLLEKVERDDPTALSIIEHEIVHLERAKKLGVLKWYILYILSPKFRLEEEIIAYRRKWEVLKKYGQRFDIEKHARSLSSRTYGKMVSFSVAKKLLTFK